MSNNNNTGQSRLSFSTTQAIVGLILCAGSFLAFLREGGMLTTFVTESLVENAIAANDTSPPSSSSLRPTTTTTRIESAIDEDRYRNDNWTDVLTDSDEYFWGNNQNISFTTSLAMDTTIGKLSIQASFQDPTQSCPHPAFRARLSGIAIVHIPMDSPAYNHYGVAGRTNISEVVVSGEAWIPIPGRYFLEVLLLHCTMDAYNTSRTSEELEAQCPLRPVIRRDLKEYSFLVHPFERSPQVVNEWIASSPVSPFQYRAWVFAPRCSNSTYGISAECTAAALSSSSSQPRLARTKAQLPEYLEYMGSNESINERFDDHVHLPVNRSDGSIDYTADYSVRTYTPPVPRLSHIGPMRRKLCFIGDSFARYMFYESKRILENSTWGTDACETAELHPKHPYVKHPDYYSKSWYAEIDDKTKHMVRRCQTVVLSFARWSFTTRHKPLTTPTQFKDGTMKALAEIESVSRPFTKTYMVSVQPFPIGDKFIECREYGVPPFVEAYNKALIDETTVTQNNMRAFKNLSRSYFLDVNDITEPLWDDVQDWVHPCRRSMRLMSRRILLLVGKDLVGITEEELER